MVLNLLSLKCPSGNIAELEGKLIAGDMNLEGFFRIQMVFKVMGLKRTLWKEIEKIRDEN